MPSSCIDWMSTQILWQRILQRISLICVVGGPVLAVGRLARLRRGRGRFVLGLLPDGVLDREDVLALRVAQLVIGAATPGQVKGDGVLAVALLRRANPPLPRFRDLPGGRDCHAALFPRGRLCARINDGHGAYPSVFQRRFRCYQHRTADRTGDRGGNRTRAMMHLPGHRVSTSPPGLAEQ